jgi:hypothetical protein
MEWVELIAAVAEFCLDPFGAFKRLMLPLGLSLLAVAACAALAHLRS